MMTTMRAFLVTVLAGLLTAAATTRAQVPFDRIVRGDAETRDWLTYSGGMLAQRHSPLTQITPANVKNLELQWVFQARSLEKFEATPLVVDGVMYTVQPPNDIVALDAVTGRVFWVYPYIPSPLARLCSGWGQPKASYAIHTQFLQAIIRDPGNRCCLGGKPSPPYPPLSVEPGKGESRGGRP